MNSLDANKELAPSAKERLDIVLLAMGQLCILDAEEDFAKFMVNTRVWVLLLVILSHAITQNASRRQKAPKLKPISGSQCAVDVSPAAFACVESHVLLEREDLEELHKIFKYKIDESP